MSDETEQLLQAYREAAKHYATARARSEYLSAYSKALLASLMIQAKAQESSVAAQEREAHASEEYRTHLRGLAAAVEQAELWKAKVREAEYRIECWRTEQANERLERKGYAA